MHAIIPACQMRALALTITVLLSAAGASAQLVSDGATKIFSGATNLGADLIVGNLAPNTTLVLTNGGSVTADNGYAGTSSAASTNNLIAVAGAGSALTIPGEGSVLRIGNASAFNRLVVSGGGTVSGSFGVVGFPAGASNNTALVTDNGSVWSNSILYVGEGGSGNSLTVAAGGRTTATFATIGLGASAGNNAVAVTGSNSLWSVSGAINVGDAGSGSQLRVSSAGTVTASGMTLGNQANSSGNRLAVVGGGAANITNAAGNSTLDVRRGNVDFNGGVITADNLHLANPTGSFTFNDGTLVTSTAVISNGQDFVVGVNPGTGAGGATFANTTLINVPGAGVIGPASPYPSTITVSNLAGILTKVTVTISNLTHDFPANMDLVLVSPDGAAVVLLANAGDIPVSGITMTFDDASANLPPLNGQIASGTYHPSTYADRSLPAPAPQAPYATNLAALNGSNPNGAWSLYAAALVGNSGESGRITNGWSLELVTASPAATWDVRGGSALTTVNAALNIGYNGADAALFVTNGAQLAVSLSSIVGVQADSVNNLAVIAGSNSLWTSGGILEVGLLGAFNTLLITNGGMVTSLGGSDIGTGSVFDLSQGGNNQAIVTGSGSLWTNGNLLAIGNYGSFNTLSVNSGGAVQAPRAVVGLNAGSGNLLSVANGTLTVTNAAANGVLEVRRGNLVFNGGTITADQLLLTSVEGTFTFDDGRLITRTATINNGQDFIIGANAGLGAGVDFANGAPLTINDFATATPYPSVITIANVAGSISKVTVTLSNLTHTFPLDIDALLVGPEGQKVMLLSDAAGNGPGVANVTLTFDDAAGAIPGFDNPSSGTYRPTDFEAGETLSPPAPAGPYSTSLSDFNGSNPNGAWSLFIMDDAAGDVGGLAAWSLNIVTVPAPVWDVRSNATPTTVTNNLLVGGNAPNGTLLITNGGTLAVSGSFSDLGDAPASVNNRVLVSGVGSFWTNSGNLRVGYASGGNQMVVSGGGVVENSAGYLGFLAEAVDNVALVTGADSAWTNRSPLFIGFQGSGNQLVVSNGATVFNTTGYIGNGTGASSNLAIVTGAGSKWTSHSDLFIGNQGSFNTLLVADGGEVVVGIGSATIGNSSGANSNRVIVTGANSLLRCASRSLDFGADGSFNTLLITNGGAVQAEGVNLRPGAGGGNLLTVDNGTLDAGQKTLEIEGGSLVFNGGVIHASQLMLNGGTFTFNSGTFTVPHAIIGNGAPFTVGDGTNAATYFMSGDPFDTHLTDGLVIANNATLSGQGDITGSVTIAPGGTLSPGSSIGTIKLQLPPTLQGRILMEITKSGGTLTNDFIGIGDVLFLGGSLVVNNLGPDTLAAGDSFTLFSTIGPVEGAFSSLVLPALPPGLMWTNALLVDGSIAVVPKTAPSISGLTKTGTNLIYSVTGGSPGAPWYHLTSTNVALPLASWTTNTTGLFDWLGNLTVTNGIDLTEPRRYFRIYAP